MLIMTSVLVFLLMRMLPGDPITLILGESQADLGAAQIAAMRHQYGLDQPIYLQYLAWAGRTLAGDFGRSALSHQPVWDVLAPRILPTLQIGLIAWLLAVLCAIPLGAVSARAPGSWQDWLGTVVTMTGAAMPYFLIGGVLIFLLALRWGWLPASGYVPLTEAPWQSLRSTVLPAITLSLSLAAVLARQARSSFADVLQRAHVRTARAKGLTERQVMLRHVMRNGMLPIVTILGVQLGTLFSGAVVIETVFAIPGIGRLLVDAILGRDYPVVQAVVLLISVAVVFANLAVDVVYGLLDPRTRQG
ncbi:MAG: ABC transporter permease [Acidisphaera sp.]|nr:ABC transporter permease [Acidisphaera sp.]